MDLNELRRWLHRAADWGVDYRESLRARPVRAQVSPGDILAQLPEHPPEAAEPFEEIFADFERLIPGGMTHWQHPRFFAYFPSNAAPPAVVAEVLATAMAGQCMLWQTSPAATELEIRMVDWLRQALGMRRDWKGVLQDTASTATLCALLTMRERALDGRGNEEGLAGQPPVRVYASTQVHSSIDKAARMSGIGQANLVKIPVDDRLQMDPEALARAIEADRASGFLPAGVVACIGGTSVGASDDLEAVCRVARAEGLFVHVDAAWAGTAMICEELRHPLWRGIDEADSVVVNPHKWLGAPLECSLHLVRDPEALVRTMSVGNHPEYLKTHGKDGLVNFSEWSVTLGRRFRALKLWFLLRGYGLEGLRQRVRDHIAWAEELAARLASEPDFEVVTPPAWSLFSFRYTPEGETGRAQLNAVNLLLADALNDDGRIYLTSTEHEGLRVLRFVTGQFSSTRADVHDAGEVICEVARGLSWR